MSIRNIEKVGKLKERLLNNVHSKDWNKTGNKKW